MNKKQFLIFIYVLGFATISFASNPDNESYKCDCHCYRRVIDDHNNEPSDVHYGFTCRLYQRVTSPTCSLSIPCCCFRIERHTPIVLSCCFRIERSVQIAPLTRSASSIESIQMESVRSVSPIERESINIPVNNPDPD